MPSYTGFMAVRANRLLIAIWICFALRLLFYAAAYPMWEGLDEWGHMGYIDHLRQTGKAPERKTPLSGQIEESLRLAPLAHHLPSYLGGGTAHTAYWKLPEEERAKRQEALRGLRLSDGPKPGLNAENYQAQHPPVAYYLMALVDRVLGFASLPDRVFALRIVLVLCVSCTLPLLWLLGRHVFAQPSLVLPTCLMLAVIPNFPVYVARVANDPLAITFMALAVFVFAAGFPMRAPLGHAAVAGLLAGLTAITKAYGILLLPVYALTCLASASDYQGIAGALRIAGALKRIAVFAAGFALLAGWWFSGNLRDTGTISGEKLDSLAAGIPLAERLPKLLDMDWSEIWSLLTSSYFWIGGWSFLLLPDWVYWLLRVVWMVAIAGLLLAAFRMLRARAFRSALTTPAFWTILVPLAILFVASIFYQSWQIFSSQGQSTAIGWYLSSIPFALLPMLAAGLGYATSPALAPRIAALLALFFAALDLFTVNLVSLPYYAGLTAVRRLSPVPVLSADSWPAGGLAELAGRLSINHPSWLSGEVLVALWLLYLGSTIALAALAIWAALQPAPAHPAPASRAPVASASAGADGSP